MVMFFFSMRNNAYNLIKNYWTLLIKQLEKNNFFYFCKKKSSNLNFKKILEKNKIYYSLKGKIPKLNFKVILEKNPEFYKLFKECILVYKNNKNFINKIIKFYIFMWIFMYAITFVLIELAVITDSLILEKAANFSFVIYYLITYPIKPLKPIIKYIFIVPSEIINFILKLLIKDRPKGPKNECSSRKEKYDEKFFIDPAENELNCANNKILKVKATAAHINSFRSLWSKFSLMGHTILQKMDYSEDMSIKELKKEYKYETYDKYFDELKKVDDEYPCYSWEEVRRKNT